MMYTFRRARVSRVPPICRWKGQSQGQLMSKNSTAFWRHVCGQVTGGGSSAGGSGADCTLGLTIVRPNLLSTPETLGNWTDGRTSCRHLVFNSMWVVAPGTPCVDTDADPRQCTPDTAGVCHEHATCTQITPQVCTCNPASSYRCECNHGYTGDGLTCTGKLFETVHWRHGWRFVPADSVEQESHSPRSAARPSTQIGLRIYELRPRCHDRELAPKLSCLTESNFPIRQLYKNCY